MDTFKQFYLLILLLFGGWLVHALGPVLTPFLVSALLAYLGDPVTDRLERFMPRTLAVVVVFLALFLLFGLVLVFLLPVLYEQLTRFVARLPVYLDWAQQRILPWLSAWVGTAQERLLDVERLRQALMAHWQQVGAYAATLVQTLTSSGLLLANALANAVLVPLVTFYLLRDWDVLVVRIRELLPRRHEPVIRRLAVEADGVLSAFLRGQLLVMLALGTVYTLGLWLVGLDLALFYGMLAGMVSFVPYLGFILGILAAGGAALVQFHDGLHLLAVLAVFGVGQVLESFVLTPVLVGDRIGLHPVAVIFAVLAGGRLFGFVGVLLALPVAAVILVVLRHLRARYLASPAYGGERGEG
ncbi:MAG: AI-2E family transporter [Gammaproteobacteria bacterium]|nr:MAG: AI-2E family transporter [Gammaproteobacteria bacterium]